jgi:hypothetical protein
MLAPFDGKIPADCFIKERLSLVEIGFRQHENYVARLNAKLAENIANAEISDKTFKRGGPRVPGNRADALRAANADLNAKFQAAVNELNALCVPKTLSGLMT